MINQTTHTSSEMCKKFATDKNTISKNSEQENIVTYKQKLQCGIY